MPRRLATFMFNTGPSAGYMMGFGKGNKLLVFFCEGTDPSSGREVNELWEVSLNRISGVHDFRAFGPEAAAWKCTVIEWMQL
eukprot:1684282-Rhodomonas_salina.1